MTIFHSDDMTAERMRANQRAWLQAGLWLAVIVAAMIGLFWEAASGAVSVWRGSETFNHCFLIPLIVGYLLWDRRAVFGRIAPAPTPWLLILMPAPALLWLIGDVAAVLEVQQFAAMAMLQIVIATVVGWAAYRALLFPCLYMFMMVPSGEWLTAPLQDVTTWFVVRGLELLSIPVYADGVFIDIPTGRFEVAEACAGLRFLIAAVAFGLLFANLIYRSWSRRLTFIALSFVVPIIANGFRAFGIVLLAYLSDNRIAAGVDHIVYGWGFFTAILLALIWFGLRYREDEGPRRLAVSTQATDRPRAGALAKAGLAALLVIAAAPAYARLLHSGAGGGAPAALAAPQPAAPWQAGPWRPTWRPVYVGPAAELAATYFNTVEAVEVYAAIYTDQSQDRKLIGYRNQLEDGEVWRRIGDAPSTILIDGRERPAQLRRLTGLGGQRRVWSIYWVDGTWTASGLTVRSIYVLNKIFRGRSRAAVVLVSSDAPTQADAVQAVQRATTALPGLGTWLAGAAARH